MKKFIIIAVLTILSSVTLVTLTGKNTISPTPIEGHIEYIIPNITSGTMELQQAKKIFNMMPLDVQEKSIAAFRDIIIKDAASFTYGGIPVKHPSDSIWNFTYNGVSITVNSSLSSLTTFFQTPPVI